MPTLTLLNDLSPAAIEQCRSSPAAAFIREYKGECRFTPNPDYVSTEMDIAIGILIDQNEARSKGIPVEYPAAPFSDAVTSIYFRRKTDNERPTTES